MAGTDQHEDRRSDVVVLTWDIKTGHTDTQSSAGLLPVIMPVPEYHDGNTRIF